MFLLPFFLFLPLAPAHSSRFRDCLARSPPQPLPALAWVQVQLFKVTTTTISNSIEGRVAQGAARSFERLQNTLSLARNKLFKAIREIHFRLSLAIHLLLFTFTSFAASSHRLLNSDYLRSSAALVRSRANHERTLSLKRPILISQTELKLAPGRTSRFRARA